MTTRGPSLCDSCVNVTSSPSTVGYDAPWQCKAYPDGIPVEIWAGGADHRQPRGDEKNGIVYKQEEGVSPALRLQLWEQISGRS